MLFFWVNRRDLQRESERAWRLSERCEEAERENGKLRRGFQLYVEKDKEKIRLLHQEHGTVIRSLREETMRGGGMQ